MTFSNEYRKLLKKVAADERLAEFVGPAKEAGEALSQLTMHLAAKGSKDQELAVAIASEYLNVFGYVTFVFSWLHQCLAAIDRDDAFGKTKIKMARFFFRHVLPSIEGHKQIVLHGKDAIMDFDESEF